MADAGRQPFDVLVAGGGITGSIAALRLAQAGARVALLERFDLGTQASGRNAGSLHAQIQHEPFVTEGEAWARAWAPSLGLLRDALAIWHGLSEELGVDLEVKTAGGLLVAEDDEQLRAIERKVALEQACGIDSVVLSRDDLRREAPYVAERMVGGELCRLEGKANPLLATPAVARAGTAAGATIVRGAVVEGIVRDHDGFAVTTSVGAFRAPRLVCAAGSEIPRLTRMVGVDLPIEGHPMQVSATEVVAPLVRHLVYFAGGRLTLKQARAGSLLIGGGWPAAVHPRSGRPTVDLDGLRRNLAVACEVVPAVAQARLLRTWTGVNNAVPDQRPIIGTIPKVPGLVVGTFPYLGFTAGPLLGALLADLALGRPVERDLAPFAPARFG